MVIQPQTMEDSEYTDMCSLVGACGDRGIYDSPSLSEDIWKKFDLDSEASDSNKIESSSYPTPPSSPQHEFCPDTDDVLKNNLHNIDDESLSRTFIGITTDVDNIQCNLIQDCMWSAPGLVAAGLIPEKSVKPKAEQTVDENSNNISPSKKQSQLDINSRDCVDPAAVFPCSSRNNSPSPSISGLSQSQESSYDLGLDTPSASSDNDSDDDEDDDDEEIDVVNVQTERHHPTIRRHHSYPASLASQRPTTLTLTLKREREPLSTLPAATSMSAQVAAMHNYSSSTGTHHNKSPSYKSYHSYSSPQTPSTSSSTHTSSSSHKRLRPYSSPASPQSSSSSSSKRQKMVVSENDLKCVVRKLTGRRSHHGGSSHHQHSSPHHHHNHHQQVTHNSSNHNSRSSSDYEDNSDIGKRAYHNVLERKRRDDLRTSFHQLRERVPEIEANERAPKMMILNKSTEYITELTQTHQNLISELQRQKQQHEQLKRKLTLLRKEAL